MRSICILQQIKIVFISFIYYASYNTVFVTKFNQTTYVYVRIRITYLTKQVSIFKNVQTLVLFGEYPTFVAMLRLSLCATAVCTSYIFHCTRLGYGLVSHVYLFIFSSYCAIGQCSHVLYKLNCIEKQIFQWMMTIFFSCFVFFIFATTTTTTLLRGTHAIWWNNKYFNLSM